MPKTYDSLIPSIELRERAWLQARERLAHTRQAPTFPSVTISREYGCEGYPLAQHLKRLLEEASGKPWTIFDKALVDKGASDEQLSRELLSHLGDESHAQDVLRTHFGYLTHDDAYAKLVKHIVPIAAGGCAIIAGRGGAIACQDLNNCFHFRLVGSFAFRSSTLAAARPGFLILGLAVLALYGLWVIFLGRKAEFIGKPAADDHGHGHH